MTPVISLTNMHLDSCIYLCTYLFLLLYLCLPPSLSLTFTYTLFLSLSFSLTLHLSLSLSLTLSLSLPPSLSLSLSSSLSLSLFFSHSLFDFLRLCLTVSFIHSLPSYSHTLFLSYPYFHISNPNISLFIHFLPFTFLHFLFLHLSLLGAFSKFYHRHYRCSEHRPKQIEKNVELKLKYLY